jgi:RND family efflux transporter MFP subunit
MDRIDVEHREDRPAAAAVAAGAPPVQDADQALWREFGQASSPEAYYRAWLALQARRIHGVSTGVVVLGPPGGPYAPAAFWPERARNLKHLAEVAERAIAERRGLVIPRPPRRDDPRSRFDVAYPIQVDGRLHGVVALDVTPRQERDLEGVLRQLQWGAAWLEVMILRDDLAVNVSIRERLQTALDLVATAFAHERFYPAATAFVTAAATKLNCDRVSLGFVERGRARVRSVSHTAQFAEKSNLMRAIAGAMDEAIDQQATIVYPAAADRPAQVTRMHMALSHDHGTAAACSIPVTMGGKVVGAITFERPQFEPGMLELAEAVAGLAGPVLELARRDDRWLAGKAMDSFRRAVGAVIGPRHLGMKAGVLAAAAAIVFLVFAQADFRVAGTTTVDPIVRQVAVAPVGGYIAEASARAGDIVRRGQLLARLDDRELRLERQKRASQYEQYVRQHQQAMAVRNAAQVVILRAQMDQVRAELALIDEQLRRLRIESPVDGIVVTGDLSQSLSAPIERGQTLFEVAPLDAYRLMIQIDERDIASVGLGQRGTLVLTGAPSESLAFTVEKITPVSTAKEARNYFRVEAKLERTDIRLRPGMEGVAKIEIDRRLLAWIWTRQVVDWVRLQLWTWLP